MKKKTTKTENRSRRKSVESRGKIDRINHDERTVQLSLPIAEIVAGVSDAVERVAGEAGLLVMKALIDEEVEQLAGKRYEHQEGRQARRWGGQESHVVFSGKKVPFKRPRVRSTDGEELHLERMEFFQSDGRMQQAASRQVALGVSMRDYTRKPSTESVMATESAKARSAAIGRRSAQRSSKSSWSARSATWISSRS